MKIQNNKILIGTGGTGGHVFPSLSLAGYLSKKYNIEIITDKRGLKYLDNFDQSKVKIINSGTIYRKNIFKVVIGIIMILNSFFLSLIFMIRSRPSLVIGMGGYSSFPICLASYCLRIPIIIYENNLIIGRANKFLIPLANKILVSTKSIQGIKKKYIGKVFHSGYILREHIYKIKKEKKNISIKKDISILIMGGSQSAKIFGEILPNILIKCFQNDFNIKIFQQCLDYQIPKLTKIYNECSIQFELFSFSHDISKYYKLADLAITRSGASSLSELINLRIPFIAIPLPSAADNHQFLNASYFEKKGYGFLLKEKFVADKLFEILISFKKNENKLATIREKMEDHSDEEALIKSEKLINKILYEQN